MKAKDIFFYVLGIVIVVGLFIAVTFLIYKGGYESTVNILIGSIAMAFGSVVNYYYGSTKGSSEKTEMIYNSTKLPDQSSTKTTSETVTKATTT